MQSALYQMMFLGSFFLFSPQEKLPQRQYSLRGTWRNVFVFVNLKLESNFSIQLPHDVCLPMLKTLCTDTVSFDGDHGFETLVSHCAVLEELVVKERWKHWSGSVSSPSLKRLYIQIKTIKSIYFHVPNLAYFELSCDFGGSTHEHACVKMNKYEHVKMDSLVEARLDLFVSNYRKGSKTWSCSFYKSHQRNQIC